MNNYEKIKEKLGVLRVYENEPLSKHTYFKIGGPARLFFEAKNSEDFKLAIKTAQEEKVPFVIIGGGANVLISDNGFEGLVIKNRVEGVKLIGIKGTINKTSKGIKNAHVWVSSGTPMNKLARFTIDQRLEGLEFLLSVPGTVGGGLKINAHFEVEKGEFIGNKLAAATLYDFKNQKAKTVDRSYFEFRYDYSKIQDTNEVILDATFKLEISKDPQKLWQKSMENVKRRNEEQPIGVACSGCTFRNIHDKDAKRLKTPNFTTSTGYIIDKLGLKGTTIGDAQISTHHANFIINKGNAKASDVIKLIKLIKTKAKEELKLDLKEEIFYIGDFENNDS
jgi:UDP-N-acetylmuramate dehydrogenase